MRYWTIRSLRTAVRSAHRKAMYCGLSSAGHRPLPWIAWIRGAGAIHRKPALWRHAVRFADVCNGLAAAIRSGALRELYSRATGDKNRSNGGFEIRIGPAPTNTGWFQVLPSIAGNRANSLTGRQPPRPAPT